MKQKRRQESFQKISVIFDYKGCYHGPRNCFSCPGFFPIQLLSLLSGSQKLLFMPKVSFFVQYTRLNNHTLSSLFILIFLSKYISLYALSRPRSNSFFTCISFLSLFQVQSYFFSPCGHELFYRSFKGLSRLNSYYFWPHCHNKWNNTQMFQVAKSVVAHCCNSIVVPEAPATVYIVGQ